MKNKKEILDITNFYTIQELNFRNAPIEELFETVKQHYSSFNYVVTFTYKGVKYILEKGNIYYQSALL